MATAFDSVDISGMRKTHFEQLYNYIIDNEISGTYYGIKKHYDKRHSDLKKWVKDIINHIESEHVITPKKPI